MARRRLTIKRIDPWSVLKFGAVVNIVLLAIFLLVAAIAWYIIERLQLVDQACGIATDVGFTSCGVDAGNLFRALLLLGALWTIVQTAVMVFFAFLHNLIADLTGGLVLGVIEDGASVGQPPARSQAASGGHTTAGGRRSDERGAPARGVAGAGATGDTGGPRDRLTASPQTSTRATGTGRRGTSDEQLFGEDR